MRNSKKIIILLLVFSGINLSCQTSEQQVVTVIDAEKLKDLVGSNVTLLDVRTPAEYDNGRIRGAKLMNFRDDNFEALVSELDKNDPVIVYCAVGGRSTGASKTLEGLGFKTIYNYKGGFTDWSNRGEPIEK